MNDALMQKLPLVQATTGVADLLDFRARSHGEKDAIISATERVTFTQLLGRAKSFGAQLKAAGVTHSDKVGIYLPNSIAFVAAFFGSIGIGAVIVPINPLLKPEEIAHILEDSETKALIVFQDFLSNAVEASKNVSSLRNIFYVASTTGGALPQLGNGVKLQELAPSSAIDNTTWPEKVSDDNEPAVIVYTSGTTGKPKGAILSHRNLLSVFPARLDLFDIGENDRCLGALPLCHIYGMTVVMIGTVGRAASLVVIPRFEPKLVLETIERDGVTILPAVPAMYSFMLAEMANNTYDVSTVRICFSGGAPLPTEAITRIEAAFNAPVIEGYALTETACVATINPLHGDRKPGSVGIAVPGVKVDIFTEDGRFLPPGEANVGEIAVNGPNLMKGYYKQLEASAEVLRNGWFLTGDLGYKDEQGYVFIVGRRKEMIIRGGANIYPKEVEDVIMRLPGVREVAVIGIPDVNMGERVKAVIAPPVQGLDEEIVRAHCTKSLADYKVPRIVEFVDALPRNSTGKVLKRLLAMSEHQDLPGKR